MKILCCFGQGEPDFSSARGIVHGLKTLGHDVLTCGPPYWDRGHDADIVFDDRDFPESYSYQEILARVPWQPDLVLQCEPHFYFHGPKPPEITSAYYFTDPHRGGAMWHKMAIQGNFNHVFVGQKYFLPLFLDLPAKVSYLPVGFDERRFPPADHYWNEDPICDVVFIGQTGLANMTFPYKDDVGQYATTTPNIWDHKKFAFGFHPGFDYAKRGELLYRLCRDFNVRIYSDVWDTPNYFRALRKGAIGFNCSLLYDLSIRCLEGAASGRLLVTDEVEDIIDRHVLSSNRTPYTCPVPDFFCSLYRLHYTPFFDNFSLSYKEVYKIIKYWLLHNEEREELSALAKYHVWERHSWCHRSEQLLNVVFN